MPNEAASSPPIEGIAGTENVTNAFAQIPNEQKEEEEKDEKFSLDKYDLIRIRITIRKILLEKKKMKEFG